MIVTVTMNPAIDKTVEIARFQHGGLNRIQKAEYDAGGKGINVSKTIYELGGNSVAAGFLGGNTGRTIEKVLREAGISCDFVRVDGETRTNTKVFEADGTLTELNEQGPQVTKAQLETLLEKLEQYARPETLFVLSGSVPRGVPADIYAQIIRRVRKMGAQTLLDADGELFVCGLEAAPEIIKPNIYELMQYAASLAQEQAGGNREAALDAAHTAQCAQQSTSEETVLHKTAEILLKKGVHTAAVSMGAQGAVFFIDGRIIRCPALQVQAHSTVGAGDAMVAALALAWEQRLCAEETVRLCMASSAGAVTTVGTKPPSAELVEKLKAQVVMIAQQRR